MNKIGKNTLLSLYLLIIGLGLCFGVLGQVNNTDKYHWILLIPIILPLAGLAMAARGLLKDKLYWRYIAFLSIIANLGLAIVIFITYSFSYWQF